MEEEAAKLRAEEEAARLKAEEEAAKLRAMEEEKEREEFVLAEDNAFSEENAEAADDEGALVYADEGEEITEEAIRALLYYGIETVTVVK